MILGVFKYLQFFVSSFCRLFSVSEEIIFNIILPVGISFYIFSTIGYMIDVYRRQIDYKIPLHQEALYILFFPKLLQGPFHKAEDFFAQLKCDHMITKENLSIGIQIFLFGLIKKIVIADRLALFVDTVYNKPGVYSAGTLFLVIITYPVQLYCDFSGYSDMAVGTARMMGYKLCQNFNLPFFAKNVTEFWRRWHMSLNIWFRDYLFYPIIRSQYVNNIRKNIKNHSKRLSIVLPSVIGTGIVFPLIGLWHGASLNFIVYGCCYGALMILEQVIGAYKNKNAEKSNVYGAFKILQTMLITIVLTVLFRAPDFRTFWIVMGHIFTLHKGIRYYYTWSLLFVPLVFIVSLYAYKKNGGNGYYIILDLSKFRNKVIFCTLVLLIIILMYVGENYFMYFKF